MRRALLVLLAILPLACTPRSSDPNGAADEGPSRQPRVPILVVAVAEEPDQLVPPFSRSPASAALWPWVLPALVRVEADSLGRGRVEPDLALSWQSEDGGRAFRFFLDSGRFWEDTTSVGASDVVESYRLYRDPTLGGGWARRLDEIVSVESPADGRGSVLFHFRRPLSRARALQLAALPVISSEQWAKTKDRKPALGEPGRPVHSAGPFRIEEWKRGEYIRLARNPFAPAGRAPRSEQLMLRFVPSGRGRAAQLQAGIADLAVDLPAEDAALLRDESPEIRLVRAGACAAEAILWNLDHPIWGGLALRRALYARLDFAAIRLVAAGGSDPPLVEPCSGLLVGGTEVESAPDAAVSSPTRDRAPAPPGGATAASDSASASPDSAAEAPDGAAAPPDSTAGPRAIAPALDNVLASSDTSPAAAGLANFGSPPLELLYDAADARRERVAIEIAIELDRLGVVCRLTPLSEADCAGRIADRRFEAVLVEWSLPALQDVGEVYESGGALNCSGFADASTDSLIILARSAAADTIPNAWERVEGRATAMLPIMFFGRRIRVDGIGPQLTGYRRDPLQPYGDLLSLERRKPPPGSPRQRR